MQTGLSHNKVHTEVTVSTAWPQMTERKNASLATSTYGALKSGRWRFAANCVVRANDWESQLDALERCALPKRGKRVQLVPVRFVRSSKVTIEDKLLVGFDALVLAGMTGHEIPFGKLIHGSEYSSLKVKIPPLAREVRRQIEQMNHCLSAVNAPGPVIKPTLQ